MDYGKGEIYSASTTGATWYSVCNNCGQTFDASVGHACNTPPGGGFGYGPTISVTQCPICHAFYIGNTPHICLSNPGLIDEDPPVIKEEEPRVKPVIRYEDPSRVEETLDEISKKLTRLGDAINDVACILVDIRSKMK